MWKRRPIISEGFRINLKWYGILALLVLIGGLAGIVIYGMNTDKSESFLVKSYPKIPLYDCEKNLLEFDKLILLVNPTESIAAKSPERIAVYEKESELLKNSCIIK